MSVNYEVALTNSVHLKGSKLGCGEGGCGACTVMVSSYNREEDAVTHMAVNACLAPLCSVDGMAVTTVEGIGSSHTTLHPVQVTPYYTSIVRPFVGDFSHSASLPIHSFLHLLYF